MDERVHEVRNRNWAEIIMACNSSGQTKAEWYRENGITLRQLYYWQKKLRCELYEAAKGDERTGLTSRTQTIFAEIPTAPMAAVEDRFCADSDRGRNNGDIQHSIQTFTGEPWAGDQQCYTTQRGLRRSIWPVDIRTFDTVLMALPASSGIALISIRFRKTYCLCSVGGRITASSVWFGKVMVFCFSTSVWRMAGFNGRGTSRRSHKSHRNSFSIS